MMGKLYELQGFFDIVLTVLENDTKSRNSNDYLYNQVCKRIYNADKNNYAYFSLSHNYALMNRKELGFPAYETVTRIRRRIQSERPDLRACASVEGARSDNEADFIVFSRGG